MAKRYVTVRVVDSGGRPVQHAKVVLWASGQFLVAPGPLPEKYTDSSGIAELAVELDDSAKISVSVNGSEKIGAGSIRSEYKVTI